MLDPAIIDENTMLLFFSLCDFDKDFNLVIKYYQNFFDNNNTGKFQKLEQYIAEMIIIENLWEKCGTLDKTLPFMRDFSLMKSVTDTMNRGKWSDALKQMKSLPRTSPFAHVRMFCKAMTIFYSDEQKSLGKSISLIPENSIFRKIGDVLEKPPGNGTGLTDLDLKVEKCIWKGSVEVITKVNAILNFAQLNKYGKQMQTTIQTLSRWIFPANKKLAVYFLLEALVPRGINCDAVQRTNFFNLINKLDKYYAKFIQLKADIFISNSLDAVVDYFDIIKKEFSKTYYFDQEDIPIAKATVIYTIVNSIVQSNYRINLNDYPSKVLKELKLYSTDNRETVLLKLVTFGISLDPENYDLYKLAAVVPCKSRPSKKIKEELFLAMRKAFPADPFPCLELAELFQDKNAYRKAQNILETALELAP